MQKFPTSNEITNLFSYYRNNIANFPDTSRKKVDKWDIKESLIQSWDTLQSDVKSSLYTPRNRVAYNEIETRKSIIQSKEDKEKELTPEESLTVFKSFLEDEGIDLREFRYAVNKSKGGTTIYTTGMKYEERVPPRKILEFMNQYRIDIVKGLGVPVSTSIEKSIPTISDVKSTYTMTYPLIEEHRKPIPLDFMVVNEKEAYYNNMGISPRTRRLLYGFKERPKIDNENTKCFRELVSNMLEGKDKQVDVLISYLASIVQLQYTGVPPVSIMYLIGGAEIGKSMLVEIITSIIESNTNGNSLIGKDYITTEVTDMDRFTYSGVLLKVADDLQIKGSIYDHTKQMQALTAMNILTHKKNENKTKEQRKYGIMILNNEKIQLTFVDSRFICLDVTRKKDATPRAKEIISRLNFGRTFRPENPEKETQFLDDICLYLMQYKVQPCVYGRDVYKFLGGFTESAISIPVTAILEPLKGKSTPFVCYVRQGLANILAAKGETKKSVQDAWVIEYTPPVTDGRSKDKGTAKFGAEDHEDLRRLLSLTLRDSGEFLITEVEKLTDGGALTLRLRVNENTDYVKFKESVDGDNENRYFGCDFRLGSRSSDGLNFSEYRTETTQTEEMEI